MVGTFKEAYENTVENITVGAGLLVFDLDESTETYVGATREGVRFTVNRTLSDPRFDNIPGSVKGGRKTTEVDVKIAGNIYNVSLDNLKVALPGAKLVGSKLTGGQMKIDLTDYKKNVALVGKNGAGKDIIIKIYNALSTGNLELNLRDGDNGEAFIAFEFTAHYDPSTITVDDLTGEIVWGDLYSIEIV